MSLAIRGNDFIFFHCQQAKNRARGSKMDPKIDTFCQVECFDHFGFRKSSFLDFIKVVLELFGSVRELFSNLKRLLLLVFSTPKDDK